MSLRQLTGPTIAALFTLTACGGDSLPSGTNSGDPLVQGEVQELLAEFFDLLEGIDLDLDLGSTAMLRPSPTLFFSSAAVPIEQTFNTSQPCDAGGTSTVVGSLEGDVNEQTGEGNASFEATADFSNCVVVGEEATYTVNGDPEVGLTADFTFAGESLTISIGMGGGIAFTTEDGRNGTCAIDMSVSASINQSGVAESVSGSICGVSAASLDAELFEDDEF